MHQWSRSFVAKHRTACGATRSPEGCVRAYLADWAPGPVGQRQSPVHVHATALRNTRSRSEHPASPVPVPRWPSCLIRNEDAVPEVAELPRAARPDEGLSELQPEAHARPGLGHVLSHPVPAEFLTPTDPENSSGPLASTRTDTSRNCRRYPSSLRTCCQAPSIGLALWLRGTAGPRMRAATPPRPVGGQSPGIGRDGPRPQGGRADVGRAIRKRHREPLAVAAGGRRPRRSPDREGIGRHRRGRPSSQVMRGSRRNQDSWRRANRRVARMVSSRACSRVHAPARWRSICA